LIVIQWKIASRSPFSQVFCVKKLIIYTRSWPPFLGFFVEYAFFVNFRWKVHQKVFVFARLILSAEKRSRRRRRRPLAEAGKSRSLDAEEDSCVDPRHAYRLVQLGPIISKA